MAHQYISIALKFAHVPVCFLCPHCGKALLVGAYCDRTSRHCDHNFQWAEELWALMEFVWLYSKIFVLKNFPRHPKYPVGLQCDHFGPCRNGWIGILSSSIFPITGRLKALRRSSGAVPSQDHFLDYNLTASEKCHILLLWCTAKHLSHTCCGMDTSCGALLTLASVLGITPGTTCLLVSAWHYEVEELDVEQESGLCPIPKRRWLLGKGSGWSDDVQ